MMFLSQTFALLALAAITTAAEVEKTLDVFAWPLSAIKSQPFAKVSYSFPSLNASIKSYSATTITDPSEIVRIGFYTSGDSWTGIATSPRNLDATRQKTLRVIVDDKGEVFSVVLTGAYTTPSVGGKTTKKADKKDEQLLVEVDRQTPGPQPHLNKPVVLNPEGKVEGEEPEKTFLQKYWWAIGLFIVVQVVMSGGGDK